MKPRKKGRIEIHVYGERLSGQWVVELHKMGCLISLFRSHRQGRGTAMAFANKLSAFCRWPIEVEEVLR
jgi:hypothetical protein